MGKPGLPLLAVICGAWFALAVPAGSCEAQTLAEAHAKSKLAWQTDELSPYGDYGSERSVQDSLKLKSPWIGSGLSLLLPGAGQFYGGAPGRGKVFLGAEVVIWGMAFLFDQQSNWKNDDAVRYAVQHAGLNPEGKDDDFLEHLEFYQNRDEYNRAGRIIDPDRPFIAEVPETQWQWDSPASQEYYKNIRNESQKAERNRTFAFYAALVNRVVASVDAFRVVNKYNSQVRHEKGLKISFKPKLSWKNPGLVINARYNF